MNRKTMLKLSPVAAALMLALGSAAHAAAPAANALPGAFLTNQATTAVSYTINPASTGTIVVPSGNTVLQFGGATSATVKNAITPTITPTTGVTTVAGFNIGSAATLAVNATAAGANVLVSDQSGQASNIYGSLVANTSVAGLFIANPNGVVVGGSTATIAATNVALVGYQANEADFLTNGQVTVGVTPSAAATLTSPSVAGGVTATANGAVTVMDGSTVNAGYLLVAGAGQVNVGSVAGATTVDVAAGTSVTATSTATNLGSAVIAAGASASLGGTSGSLTVDGLGAAGAVSVANTVVLNNASVAGTLTNNGTLTLGGTNNVNALVNNVTAGVADVAGTYGSITNNAYLTLGNTDTVSTLTNNANATVGTSTFGAVTNNANLVAGVLDFGGAFANAGSASVGSLNGTNSAATVNNSGVINNTATAVFSNAGTLASFTNTGKIYDGGYGVNISAGSISLGGSIAASAAATSGGPVTLTANTGDLTGTASITTPDVVSLTAVKGNINYTGSIAAALGVNASATTGAVTLGAVNASTASLSANAGNGSLTLGGNIIDSGAILNAVGGSVLINGNITDAGSVNVSADNQIMVNGNVVASAGNVSLTTNNHWSGPYNLGVVIQPSGGVTANGVFVAVAVGDASPDGNMLQYGTLAAKAGFQFVGNSYYQGAGAQINTSLATFIYGNATSGGVITGGIVAGSKNPQPSNAFYNAVVVGGSNVTNVTTGVTLRVSPNILGSVADNVNLMGIGNTTLQTILPLGVSAQFGSTGSAVTNNGYVPSNLFVRAQGGDLNLAQNSGGGFYWPGLIYASTVQAGGNNATVDTTKTITFGAAGNPVALSNALPFQPKGGEGVYLMTGKINVGDITTNTGSNVNVLNALQVAGVNLYTSGKPTGLVLSYNATSVNVVPYTPPAN